MQKEITTFSFVGNNTERNKRQRKAMEYIQSIAERKRKRKELVIDIITVTVIAIAILIVMSLIIRGITMENSYYKQTDTKQSDGSYYVYVTEKDCTVIETDIEKGIVTVDYKGNAYSFYGDGYIEGEKIICQFTDAMEIVGVIE